VVARHFYFGTFDAAPSRGVHAITYTRVRKTGATSFFLRGHIILPNRFFQRAVIKFWRRMVPRFSILAGGRGVHVSGNNLKPKALLTWTYGWKAEIIRQILEIEDGDFIDIGANVGQTLLDFYAAGAARRYIGFEPHPKSFASLCTLAWENDFENCVILPVGLSDTLSVLNLYSVFGATETDSGASIVPDLRVTKELKHTPILCCRFDDLRGDLNVTSIGLVKIDVEGAELQVLRGMEGSIRELRPPIVSEILYADAHADILHYESNVRSIMRFLDQLEYTVFRIQKDRQEEQFLGLLKTTAFPIQVWTPENAHECDYLLIPTEKMHDYERLIDFSSGRRRNAYRRAPELPVK
jgi:FkbM family methyltransferase